MLEACCEEDAEKLAKEETQTMEGTIKARRVRWTDLNEKTETRGHDQREKTVRSSYATDAMNRETREEHLK